MRQKGIPQSVSTPTLRDIKEKTSLLSSHLDNTSDMSQMTYKLPDGRSIRIDNEARYHLGRSLFYQEPSQATLQNMMLEAIKSVDIDLRRSMLANIVFSGGTANAEGFD